MDGRPAGSFPGHVFISYVREDRARLDRLQRVLEEAGITVWRDTANLWAGQDWKVEVRRAITTGSLAFLACFSENSERKRTSYQREELILAAEQMRLRSPGRPWLIPVRFAECYLPDVDLGPGRTLDSLHRIDLFDGSWTDATPRLVGAVLRVLDGAAPDAAQVAGHRPDATSAASDGAGTPAACDGAGTSAFRGLGWLTGACPAHRPARGSVRPARPRRARSGTGEYVRRVVPPRAACGISWPEWQQRRNRLPAEPVHGQDRHSVRSGPPSTIQPSPTGLVEAVAFSVSNETLAVGLADGDIYLWNLSTDQRTMGLRDPRGGILNLAFSSDGQTLAEDTGAELSSYPGDGLYLWNLRTRQHATLPYPGADLEGAFGGVAFSRNGKALAASDTDGNIYLWSLPAGKHPVTLPAAPGLFLSRVAFSPNSQIIAAAGNGGQTGGEVVLWNLSKRKNPVQTENTSENLGDVAFSPDSRILAAGDGNGTIYLWRVG